MKYVTNWNQFFKRCEELVPIFHGVKFAKYEICGSTYTSSGCKQHATPRQFAKKKAQTHKGYDLISTALVNATLLVDLRLNHASLALSGSVQLWY